MISSEYILSVEKVIYHGVLSRRMLTFRNFKKKNQLDFMSYWGCSNCTFNNPSSASFCEMCTCPRAKPLLHPVSQPTPAIVRATNGPCQHFFSSKGCSKGDRCDYSHSMVPKQRHTPPSPQRTLPLLIQGDWEWMGPDGWRPLQAADDRAMTEGIRRGDEIITLQDSVIDVQTLTMIRNLGTTTKVRRRAAPLPPSPAASQKVAVPSMSPATRPSGVLSPEPTKPLDKPLTHEGSLTRESSLTLAISTSESQLEAAEAEVHRIQMECRQSRVKHFVDKDFPANDTMLPRELHGAQWQHYTVKQPQTKWQIFSDAGPSGNHIRQGELGDCWFLSAVSVLAFSRVDIIAGLFSTRRVNPEGVFGVRFWRNGAWVPIIVDGYFPVKYNQFQFGCCTEEDLLWVQILEKAYAKLHGSYDAIVSGNCLEAFYDLTGAPSETHELNGDRDLLWATIMSFTTSQCVVGASCGRKETAAEARRMGLCTNHCYSLLRVMQTAKQRVAELRNPWGKTAWSGRYCRGSPEWAAEIKPMLSTRDDETETLQDQGRTWMPFDDFLKYFSRVDICRCLPGWSGLTLWQASFEHVVPPTLPPYCAHIKIKKPTWCYVLATQRSIRGTSSRETLFDQGILIAHVDRGAQGHTYRYHSNQFPAVDTVVMLELHLEPGIYAVFTYSFQATLSETMAAFIYSPHHVSADMEPIQVAAFKDLLTAAILQSPHTKISLPFPGVRVIAISLNGLAILAAVNESSLIFSIKVKTAAEGYVSSRWSFDTHDVLEPNQSQIIHFMVVQRHRGSYSCQYKSSQSYVHGSHISVLHSPALLSPWDLHTPSIMLRK